MPGKDAIYQNTKSVLEAAESDPKLHAALVASADDAEENLITSLFQSRSWGIALPHNWTTQNNGAKLEPTIYACRCRQVEHFRQRTNENEVFLSGFRRPWSAAERQHNYSVTFANGALPPVKGFWSLTLYNQQHFFSPNELKRYSVRTNNKTLVKGSDGSLTIYVQSTPPEGDKRANWLPAGSCCTSVLVGLKRAP